MGEGERGGCQRTDSVLQVEFFEFGFDDEAAVGVFGFVLFVVVLVVDGARVEGGGGGDFGDDGFGEQGGGGFFGGFGDGFLFGGVVEDGGAVLGADVIALAIEGGGIVEVPEPGEEFLVGDFFRVEDDADDFGVTGGAFADIVVGWVFDLAAHESGYDGVDAVELAEGGFDAPVAAGTEGGDFGSFGDGGKWGRFHGFSVGWRFAGSKRGDEEGEGEEEFFHVFER